MLSERLLAGDMRLTCRCANLHIPFRGGIRPAERAGKRAVRQLHLGHSQPSYSTGGPNGAHASLFPARESGLRFESTTVGLHVLNCELFVGRSRYRDTTPAESGRPRIAISTRGFGRFSGQKFPEPDYPRRSLMNVLGTTGRIALQSSFAVQVQSRTPLV